MAEPPPSSEAPAQPRAPLPAAVRHALFALAIVSLALGVVGLFLPVMPTVPFVLLAAWAAARSSPRLDAWLERHPHMGPHIVRWRRGGVVPRGAKWMATVMMAGSATGMLVFLHDHWLPYVAITCMIAVLIWLWRRPESPPTL